MFRSYLLMCLIASTLLILLPACNRGVDGDVADDKTRTPNEPAALAAVAKRIEGFNNHNLDAYLAAHQEDVQIYEYLNIEIGSGRSHLKKIFGPFLEQGIGEIRVEHQVAIGNIVISDEYVSYGGSDVQHLVAIYNVERGLITSIRLVESQD